MGITLAVSALYFVQAVQLGRAFADHGVGSPADIGVYVTLASLGVMLGGWVFTRLPALALPRVLALIMLCYAVGYGGIAIAPSAKLALVAAWVAQFGNGLAIPALIGWSLIRFAPAHRGRGMGLWGAAFLPAPSSALLWSRWRQASPAASWGRWGCWRVCVGCSRSGW